MIASTNRCYPVRIDSPPRFEAALVGIGIGVAIVTVLVVVVVLGLAVVGAGTVYESVLDAKGNEHVAN